MNMIEKQHAIKRLQAALDAVQALPNLTPCADCGHFASGYCNKWAAEVPPDAQADGCADWDYVPF